MIIAGLLTPYHLGASEQLKKYKIINKNTSLSGSSGGALAAITSGYLLPYNNIYLLLLYVM